MSLASRDRLRVIRGRVLTPRTRERRVDLLHDAVLRVDAEGVIVSIDEADRSAEIPETWPGAVILPGFVDAHVHFPQTRILGSASGPLLDWLRAAVFPEEARFADRDYAAEVAEEFCADLLAQGTTSAAIFSSSHLDATDALFEALSASGLRAQAGLTLMNRGAPADLLLDTTSAVEAAESLIARWHGHDDGRLRFCVTPRFALSCDAELLRAAARLASCHDLWIQTHLSENRTEIAVTADAFPEAADYLDVYETHGLAGSRSIFAHCIHLSDGEWNRLADHGSSVAHCPDSNFFLGSGTMPLDAALDRASVGHGGSRGLRLGLGTDVGAGRTFSLRRVASSAYDATLMRETPVTPETLLWLATRGGAEAIGFGDRVGCLAPGFEADLAVVDVPGPSRDGPIRDGPIRDAGKDRLVDSLLFRHDASTVRATVVRGRVRWRADQPVRRATKSAT